jgi:hypothetical protein
MLDVAVVVDSRAAAQKESGDIIQSGCVVRKQAFGSVRIPWLPCGREAPPALIGCLPQILDELGNLIRHPPKCVGRTLFKSLGKLGHARNGCRKNRQLPARPRPMQPGLALEDVIAARQVLNALDGEQASTAT